MQLVVQNVRNGRLSVETAPDPMLQPGCVLIANRASVISAGTEKSVRALAQKSLWAKARQRPDQVRRVLAKIATEGLWQTWRQVNEKLDEPMSLGYCSAGVVLAAGHGVEDLKPGDRVASNGPHADVVCVPRNLCAAVPEQVPFDHAAFAVLGAIALQGVRLAEVSLGETVFVIGLGLLGQIAVELLSAAGARVIGTDLDAAKCELAAAAGAAVARPGLSGRDVAALTGGLGADAVLIAASTPSDGPVELAGEAVRQKGRVVALGAVGLNLPRRPYYFKEASFVVSCSYGPGRYDPRYEALGHDYPPAYVRWTERRNMEAVLSLIAAGRLNVARLISHRFPIAEAARAYELIETNREPYLGIALEYPAPPAAPAPRRLELSAPPHAGTIGVGWLGAGNFARLVLLPALARVPALRPEVLCSASGLATLRAGRKLGFRAVSTDERDVLADSRVDAVFVVTRHDHHARQVVAALAAGKHVFVEKPLALSEDELAQIEDALAGAAGRVLLVGFNRRFSPAAVAVRKALADCAAPLTVSIRFNAGAIGAEHWTQDPASGGGRIVGEACHAIDLATYLVGSPPVRVFAESIGGPLAPPITDDQSFLTLRHANGSISSIAYLAGGDAALGKERVEVLGGGQAATIDDFCRATLYRGGRRRTLWRGRQDKGHQAELAAFAEAISPGGPPPIAWSDLRAVSLAALRAVESLRIGAPLEVA